MEYVQVGSQTVTALGIGVLLAFVLPFALALIWKIRKKERFTTILVGAAVFFLFALILEKSILSMLVGPDHAVSRFLNANPVLLALVMGLFPGVFEETGRLVAFKTLLRKRTNRETAVSYGIGHGGFEVMMVLGVTYITYVVYAGMINAGAFGAMVEQVAALAPDQADALNVLAGQIAGITPAGIGLAFVERAFAMLLHIGLSILVFYACRDRKRFRLFPLAVLLHTALDFIVALNSCNVIGLSIMALEVIAAAFGVLTFGAAYILLYRKDASGDQK